LSEAPFPVLLVELCVPWPGDILDAFSAAFANATVPSSAAAAIAMVFFIELLQPWWRSAITKQLVDVFR